MFPIVGSDIKAVHGPAQADAVAGKGDSEQAGRFCNICWVGYLILLNISISPATAHQGNAIHRQAEISSQHPQLRARRPPPPDFPHLIRRQHPAIVDGGALILLLDIIINPPGRWNSVRINLINRIGIPP